MASDNHSFIVQLIDVIIRLLQNIQYNNYKVSVTAVSGSLSSPGTIHSNQLVFEDNFDHFNLRAWKHSLTLSGKGVSKVTLI